MNLRLIINDVGNADAIFFALQKQDNVLAGVVDGGRENDGRQLVPKLSEFLHSYGKEYPDIIIGTHFDNDHIAGLLPILEYFNNPAIRLFMFDTSNHLIEAGNRESPLDTMVFFPSENDDILQSEYCDSIDQSVLSTLKKEKDILDFARLNGISVIEPIAGVYLHPHWPEAKFIGPTIDYYHTLFPEKEVLDSLRSIHLQASDAKNNKNIEDPCEEFTLTKSPVTRVNLLSALLKIDVCDKSILLTGDAGIDSFYAIPNYTIELSNLHWLKLPHHGSRNNINLDLITLMNPKTVGISGGSYISESLIKCLIKRNITVNTTKTGSFEIII